MMNKKFIDKEKYHGVKLMVNNSSKCSKIRVNRKERYIEFNYNFMYRLKESQQVFLLEWGRANLRTKDIFKCDKKAFYRITTLGYCQEDIVDLFNTVSFSNRALQKKRLYYLVTQDAVEYKVSQIVKKINIFSWIMKIFAPKK